MTEQEAIARMVPPGARRKGIWREGVLQIHITRACDKACFGCTQGSNLGGKPVMMTPDQFEKACDSLQGYFGVVGVFGGNPCLSPYFEEICEIMRAKIPFVQRGLWSNKLMGKGKVCRVTFNPQFSNLNVHLDKEAYDEMVRDWPEAKRFVKGHDQDSRHSPPFVAMQDLIEDKSEHWNLIANCDINKYWSAMICVFRGELRGYFCELAGAQAMLHQYEPDYPDLGVPIEPGWWQRPMQDFAAQVRYHCPACGIPLRGYGELAVNGKVEQVSKTHASIYKPKVRDREVQIVTTLEQLRTQALPKATDYIQNSKL